MAEGHKRALHQYREGRMRHVGRTSKHREGIRVIQVGRKCYIAPTRPPFHAHSCPSACCPPCVRPPVPAVSPMHPLASLHGRLCARLRACMPSLSLACSTAPPPPRARHVHTRAIALRARLCACRPPTPPSSPPTRQRVCPPGRPARAPACAPARLQACMRARIPVCPPARPTGSPHGRTAA